MKKSLVLIFIILLFPASIFAYSNYLLPGGESVGISVDSNGLVIVGFYKVDGEFIAKSTLKIGDYILKINQKEVSDINDLANLIDENITSSREINITIKRGNKIKETTMNLKEENGVFKTGIYVKNGITGIGTLTYIDPVTKVYGALGHEIILNETGSRIEIKNGSILENKIINIDRSTNGNVGSKNAKIFYDKRQGSILSNTNHGIFGLYTGTLPNKNTIEIASFEEIKTGKASIYTVIENNEIREFEINIIDIYKDKKNTTKAFSFEVIDEQLLNETGGIVQGMSGSPVIQNNKIIGGVTHVLVDKVNLGYGIYIKTMLEEGDKILIND